MRCRKARRIIHLNREGEIARDLLRAAEEHAAGCPDCSDELARRAAADVVIAGLRAATPSLHDGPGLTMHIMRAIESGRSRRRLRFASDRFLKRIQLGSALALTVLGAFFFVQSYRDARALEELEERLGHVSEVSAARRVAPPRGGLPSSIDQAQHLLSRTDAQWKADSPFSSGLRLIIDLARRGLLINTTEMEQLQARYPGLWSISLEDGLDARERAILSTEGRAFLNDVKTFVNLAEPLDEE